MYNTTKKDNDYEKYKECRNLVVKELRKARIIFEQKFVKDVKNNPKSFYRYVRTKTKSKDKVGPLKDSAGNLIEENNRMCDTLNNFLISLLQFSHKKILILFRKLTVFLLVIAVSCYVLLKLHLRLYSIKSPS